MDLKQLTAQPKGAVHTGVKVVHDPHDYGDGLLHYTIATADGSKLVSLAGGAHELNITGENPPDPAPAPPTPVPPAPAAQVVVGMNCPWFCTGNDTGQAYAQVDELLPKVIRDPGLKQARWDHAASKGVQMMPLLESPNISALAWAVKHPAFSGVVELSNEPFWNGISAASWVNTWAPVIDGIKQDYPDVKLLAPIDDWPASRSSGPGTAAWTEQLLAARPSLKTEIYGWAIHPYEDDSPTLALAHLQNGIDALRANGIPSPRMFCTEWGWSRFNVTEAVQATNAQAFLKGVALKPEVEWVFWYQLNDTLRQGATGWNRDAGFGLLREPASANWDDLWAKASVWQVMRDAISASPVA